MLSAATPRDAPLYNHFASESKAAIFAWELSDETAAGALDLSQSGRLFPRQPLTLPPSSQQRFVVLAVPPMELSAGCVPSRSRESIEMLILALQCYVTTVIWLPSRFFKTL